MAKKPTRPSARFTPELGSRRFTRYRDAFDRAAACTEAGYPLEAIALLDSLISDRLASRLGYSSGQLAKERLSCGGLCHELLRPDVERDPAFREVVTRIRDWVAERNHAMHASAKALKSADGPSFSELLDSHGKVAAAGIALLRAFDELDVADRKKHKVGMAATQPHAFHPEKRGGRAPDTPD